MLVIILLVLAATLYYLLKLNYQYWEKRGVPGPKPTLLVGNLGKAFLCKVSPGVLYAQYYNQYQNEDLVGLYRATTPILLLRDPELIKEITTRSFNHFRDNDIELDKKNDPIFGRNPFALKGDEWKMVRAQLTPGFTSGKMKWLFPLLEEVCNGLVEFIETQPDTTNGHGYEAKELSMKFTLNNVATCAFGLQGRCFEEENSNFRQLAREFFAPDGWGAFSFFVMTVYPPISKLLPLRFVTKEVERKLIKMISQTLKYREENNIIRNDFLHIMKQLKASCKDYDFTDIDVTAHAAGFFGDGFETSSIVMSFTLFELAANRDVQNRLREEIHSCAENNKLTYDGLQNCQYLEACVLEALRLHPALFFLQKQCTKDFTLTTKKIPLRIEKGTPIILPVYGIHTDPKHFDEPKSYRPERFLGNRDNLTKYTFLAFGEGPRACLGQRFGLLQVKAGIAYIIQRYELFVNKKTQLPIKYAVSNAMTQPIGGLWLDFKKVE